MKLHQLWWAHARVPLMAFVLLSTLFATSWTDIAIARAVFFDPAAMRWVGADSWWTNEFLHTGGRWFIRGLVACALALCIAGCMDRDLRKLRRPAAYFVLAVVLSTAIVGLLKTLTNVDCPWDLAEFGGRFPFVELFANRPDGLRHGNCFPAAHASSGYALLALYFVFRERNGPLAKLGLGAGVISGLIFGIAQQSRGAHFVSHDVWSAFLVWMISLTVYAFVFQARLWSADPKARAGYVPHDAPAATSRLVIDRHADLHGRAGGLAGAARQ